MKVYIGNYPSHYSLYNTLQRMEIKGRITKEQSDDIYDFIKDHKILDNGLQFVYDILNKLFYREQKVKVHIDKWDTWNMDGTLAHIIHPMLVQLKETQHGAPNVDDEDVPESLYRTKTDNDWDTDSNHFKRWEYVLDEMIWTFDEIRLGKTASDMVIYPEGYFDNWIETKFVKLENEDLYEMVPHPDDDKVIRPEAEMKAYNERRKNGLRLFGKYYHSLWD